MSGEFRGIAAHKAIIDHSGVLADDPPSRCQALEDHSSVARNEGRGQGSNTITGKITQAGQQLQARKVVNKEDDDRLTGNMSTLIGQRPKLGGSLPRASVSSGATPGRYANEARTTLRPEAGVA